MARTSHIRGQFKSKARPIVATIFGFETSTARVVQDQNRDLVEKLKQNSSFIYRVSVLSFVPTQPNKLCCEKTRGKTLEDHDGIYQNKGIQQLINEVLFKNKADDGITWMRYYKPFPVVAFALALTAVRGNITGYEYTNHGFSLSVPLMNGCLGCTSQSRFQEMNILVSFPITSTPSMNLLSCQPSTI